jgi:hypothetical protein
MIYYLYKITNKINGNFYIGRRAYAGDDLSKDTYFGSGLRLKAAILKYGKENFTKEVTATFNTEEELIAAEKNIVNEALVSRSDCYNLAIGGNGGYTYYSERIFKHSEESKRKISKANTGRLRPDSSDTFYRLGINKWWEGKARSKADKEAKSKAAKKSIEEGKHASKRLVTCPHCDYTTGVGNAKRWHFDNCKRKK